jgi:hypothetical protein
MPARAALLAQCLDQAVAASARLIAGCVDEAVAALSDAERQSGKSAERHELSDAGRELLQQRAAWIERFPRELHSAVQSGSAPAAATSAPPARLDQLTLVNDDQVDRQVDAQRLSQVLQTLTAQPLAELDGMVSSLLGLPAVRPEENPLRPDIYARVLRAMMADARQPGRAALWLQHMAPTMGRELERLYRALILRLTEADVQAAGYRILPIKSRGALPPSRPGQEPPTGALRAFSAPGPVAGAAPQASRMRGGSAWPELQSAPIGHNLIQDFLFHAGGRDGMPLVPASAPLAPAYYARVSTELARLEAAPVERFEPPDSDSAQRYARLPTVERPSRSVSTDTTLDSGVWGRYGAASERSLVRTRLKHQARDADQVLGLEVVRQLVNQVAQDPRLLAPVREAIVALEPSLLRLAMADPRFFGDEQHPGRRLVERVAERSLTFNDEFSTEFGAFSASVAAGFNQLNALDESAAASAAPFRAALDRLEAHWSAQDQAEAARRQAVLDAVQFAEQRQAQADQIAWELSQRGDLEGVPSIVQDFVYGPWALAMAQARLTDGGQQIDPGAYGGLITDLLWSVKRDATLHDPARLIEMLPGLLARLRAGLAALGQAPQESEAFFQSLEQLHRPVLRLRAKKRRSDSAFTPLEPQADSSCLEPAARQSPKSVHLPWMGRHELGATGFQDTLPTHPAPIESSGPDDAGLASGAAPDGPASQQENIDVDAVIAGLREGCWVDLYSRRHWLRAKLVWASSKGTLFMFVSRGGQPHSMTRRTCERLLREGLVRPVAMHGAVSHALHALAQSQPQSQSQPQALAA